ncbi:hypothetical protein T03_8103 [Trichinella britovi]|uniref:Uncharacterized protein n=1 Tax=Trichinella britovi TaxID=45882 RepID=A0A0V1C4F2_TRIBR|nr:hypothetical protein T03_8103 [Trichinella britovi]
MFVNQYCTLDVSFGCENVTGKARTVETKQHGRQHPDGQYDCADEPDDRKRLLSASDYRDSRPVGATNELILEIGSLPHGVDWKKLLAFIDTNMSVTVMKNGENQSQSLKTLMRRKLTIYVLRKSDVWLMQKLSNENSTYCQPIENHPSEFSGRDCHQANILKPLGNHSEEQLWQCLTRSGSYIPNGENRPLVLSANACDHGFGAVLCRRLPYCSIKLANTRGCVQISATPGETCGGAASLSRIRAQKSRKMPQGFRVNMDVPQLVTMFNVSMRTIFTFDRVSKCNFDPS